MNGIQRAAHDLGKLGGLKGGPARAAKLSKEQRSLIAVHAARKRWGLKTVYAPTTWDESDWAEKAKGAIELVKYHDAVCPEYELRQWLQDVLRYHSKPDPAPAPVPRDFTGFDDVAPEGEHGG